MKNKIKYLAITIIGSLLTIVGLIFIVLPGPAFLFLPIGLAVLSLEHEEAKKWLRRCQRWMRKSAVQADKVLFTIKSKFKNS